MSLSDQLFVERIVKKSGSSFYWGMKLLEPSKKRGMFAIYDFCRKVDDIADNSGNKISKQNKLKEWKKNINLLYNQKIGRNRLLRELAFSINKFKLRKEDFFAVIDGMMMDVSKKIQFPSKKNLKLYCTRVAVSVGLLSIRVFGLKSKLGQKYAYSLGMAFQITNIVRDFNEDLKINRCYIPMELIKKYKVEKNLRLLKKNSKIQNILQDLLIEANFYFLKSDKLSENFDKKKIVGSEIMKLFYRTLHKKMFNKNIHLNKKIKLNYIDKLSIFIRFILR
ncbi:MAG: hypothetical protein CMM95_00110 [Rickettsiales bacterium]|nr:hypothetical protein [Rickettsiales bacterium]